MMRLLSKQLMVICALAVSGWLGSSETMAQRPNVLVILTDDQGWGDLSVHGNKNLTTPNIDQLAAEGASFDRFYVCPVCSPTRAEFLTGRYHPHSNVYSTSAGGERMNLKEKTIADSFRMNGYRTAAFGKWHNGMQYPYHPNARGFDEFYGFCSGHWGNYWDPMLDHNGEVVQGKGFIIDDLTDHAIDFMNQDSKKPFFVYLPYNTPHSPMQVPDRWWNKFKDLELKMHNREPKKENVQHIRAALAMCENIDWNVGRLMKALKDSGKENNTIVVYFCDNGPNGFRWNGDMKGRKGSTDEGGVRSPCFVKWPRRIAGGRTVKSNGAAIDLHPTLANLAGLKRTANQNPFDGANLAKLLTIADGDEDPKKDDRIIVSHWKGKISAKMGPYRMDNSGRMFDLTEDPGQRKDMRKQRLIPAGKLQDAINKYREELLPGYGEDDRPFIITHPDTEITQVPARDGKANGGIKRSNKFPNSSFFTNWTSTEDSITWDAAVHRSGKYDVEIYYSCPEGSEGSEIELSFGASKITAKVEKAHPSKLVGADEDRFKRVESYEQNWGKMSLGTIEFPGNGSGTLTLRATKVAGDTVMDFRTMLLRRAQQQ